MIQGYYVFIFTEVTDLEVEERKCEHLPRSISSFSVTFRYHILYNTQLHHT